MDTKKRIISMLLSLVMILQIILPVPAMAATNDLSSKKTGVLCQIVLVNKN